MTIKTVSYNTETHRIVPVEPDDNQTLQMLTTIFETLTNSVEVVGEIYKAAIEAAPEYQPALSAESIGYIQPAYLEHRHCGTLLMPEESATYSVAVFAHPPAQPVKELSEDEIMAVYAHCADNKLGLIDIFRAMEAAVLAKQKEST